MQKSIAILTAFVGLVASGLVLFGFLGPEFALADSVSHFRLHLSGVLVLAAAVLALCRSWVATGLFATLALAGGLSTAALTGLLTPATALPKGEALRLLTFNMRYNNTQHEAVIAAIRDADPDVVFLQEVSPATVPITAALEVNYRLLTNCHQGAGDLAILVRPRFRATERSGCEPYRGVAWSEIDFGSGRVTLMAVHLHWPAPFRQPLDLDALERVLPGVPRPIVAAGDFNATPWSHAVGRIARGTGTVVVPGVRPSWVWRALPAAWATWMGLPLDHVLLPEGGAAESVRVLDPAGSDHLPIVADIVLR